MAEELGDLAMLLHSPPATSSAVGTFAFSFFLTEPQAPSYRPRPSSALSIRSKARCKMKHTGTSKFNLSWLSYPTLKKHAFVRRPN